MRGDIDDLTENKCSDGEFLLLLDLYTHRERERQWRHIIPLNSNHLL